MRSFADYGFESFAKCKDYDRSGESDLFNEQTKTGP
jgi:hypothetical protein